MWFIISVRFISVLLLNFHQEFCLQVIKVFRFLFEQVGPPKSPYHSHCANYDQSDQRPPEVIRVNICELSFFPQWTTSGLLHHNCINPKMVKPNRITDLIFLSIQSVGLVKVHPKATRVLIIAIPKISPSLNVPALLTASRFCGKIKICRRLPQWR